VCPQKDLSDVYALMRTQLNRNVSLLLTYFNVMILGKALKQNKSFETSPLAETGTAEEEEESARGDYLDEGECARSAKRMSGLGPDTEVEHENERTPSANRCLRSTSYPYRDSSSPASSVPTKYSSSASHRFSGLNQSDADSELSLTGGCVDFNRILDPPINPI
jgi:hypothetical protein